MVSGKEGGSGLGLAISRQLAHHLSAKLDLKRSDLSGCLFELAVPAEVVHASEQRAEESLSGQAVPLANR